MKLQAHLSNNMGVRASSCDELFPFTVMAMGNPHTKEGVRWYVRTPAGQIVPADGFARPRFAHAYGMALKGGEPVTGCCWLCGGKSPTGLIADCEECTHETL